MRMGMRQEVFSLRLGLTVRMGMGLRPGMRPGWKFVLVN